MIMTLSKYIKYMVITLLTLVLAGCSNIDGIL